MHQMTRSLSLTYRQLLSLHHQQLDVRYYRIYNNITKISPFYLHGQVCLSAAVLSYLQQRESEKRFSFMILCDMSKHAWKQLTNPTLSSSASRADIHQGQLTLPFYNSLGNDPAREACQTTN